MKQQVKPIVQNPQQQVVGVTMQQMTVQPLHSPDMLAKYNEVSPGFAAQVLAMAQKEQDHRHQQEEAASELLIWNTRALNWNIIRGQVLAFLSVLVMAGLCGYMVYAGAADAASKTAIYVIATLAAVFLGRAIFKGKDQKKEAAP
jgi:uncharacterized membrane protein